MKQAPHLLVILDGFGIRKEQEFNAVYQAHPPCFNNLMNSYPHALLEASGTAVGLLPHMMGNSEVGHLTIGAGRPVEQPVLEITTAIENGSFFKDPLLLRHFQELAQSKKRLHLMGLLSDGGVHSYFDHLKALINLAVSQGIESIIVHPFLDGRDVAPQSAASYLRNLERLLSSVKKGSIGTLHGRFYAMDRDKNWERTQLSYSILTTEGEPTYNNWHDALNDSYRQGISDEFFVPIRLQADAFLKAGDGLIFFNFRADRARQLTQSLVNQKHIPFPTRPLDLAWVVTFTSYAPDLNVDVYLKKEIIKNSLGDIIEAQGLSLFTIAETEKYAHVTYFFNGGRELIRSNETRILVRSKPSYSSYVDHPEMAAQEITTRVLRALDTQASTFYLINYANADMVGHSGNYEATIKAIQALDEQLAQLYKKAVLQLGGTLYITADHGNAEEKWDYTQNQPRTSHTTNKVPFIHVQKKLTGSIKKLDIDQIGDIAPYIIKDLEGTIPPEMKRT